MESDEPYFSELEILEPSNSLHQAWLEYALSLTRDDVLYMVRHGLTHQAAALRKMIREVIAGVRVPRSLLVKLETVRAATERKASELR